MFVFLGFAFMFLSFLLYLFSPLLNHSSNKKNNLLYLFFLEGGGGNVILLMSY
ncbi:MAG: hypothetical protein EXX96DRAFT_289455 [Benjaminiella poitrasii]|nr:MAG: hypothetical protein EXX96DRAFT_289455 [Benjaminiella poitrasii]